MSPEIKQTNQIRWRMAIADRRWREALELLRAAAAAPSYSGPPVEVVERMAAVMAEIRDQVHKWQLDENIRHTSRVSWRMQRRTIGRAADELYGRR